jgi:hypothetical protein
MVCETKEKAPIPGALRLETSSAAPIHLHFHVPKCAGQTIDQHLTSALPPDAYYRTRKTRGIARMFKPRYDLAGMPDPDAVRIVSGHYLGISMEQLFAGRPVRRSVLLRDPVTHIVSYYNFRMMLYMSNGWQPYGFDLAYGATQRNFITHYILRNFLELPWSRIVNLTDDEKYELVNAFLASFWYVGDYRLCDDFLAAIGARLGIATEAIPRNTRSEWECRAAWRSLDLDDLSPSRIAEIRRENMIDQKLWETWHEAGHDTRLVRPRPLAGQASSGAVSREATRFVCQVARRIKRRWSSAEGLPVPSAPVLATR